MSNFIYTSSIVNHLENMLSSDRFETYVSLAMGNKENALSLYKKNILISHKFYTALHILEVCLRNKIDMCLSSRYGQEWYTNSQTGLITIQKKLISEVSEYKGHGQLVASLPFGFWTSFFGRSFEELWRHELRLIFTTEGPLKRSYIAAQLKEIRNLRNRIAHHECILKLQTVRLETALFELIHLLSPVTLKWLKLELLK